MECIYYSESTSNYRSVCCLEIRRKILTHLMHLIKQTKGVECRKDTGVLDEIPAAHKPIEQVLENQSDLVEVEATLKQVLCVKG